MKISENLSIRQNSFAYRHIFSFDKVMVATTTCIACVCPNVITASILGAVLFLKGKTKWRKQELSLSPQGTVLVTLVLTLVFSFSSITPAQAALFEPLESFMTQAFPQSQELVSLVFNSLTFLLLAAIAVVIVNAFIAIGRGEPISNVIQTPITLILVILITELILPFVV